MCLNVSAAIAFIGTGLVVLYMINAKFAFRVRVVALNAYIAIMSSLVVPLMIFKGRNVDNLRWCCRGMIPGRWLFGLKRKIIAKENMIRDKPCVIISNHQSTLDLFGMADIFPQRATFLAKKELLYYGPLGLCFWLCGAVFIDRKAGGGRSVMERCAQEVLDRNLKIWIFPEGTRSTKPGMLPFKKGAFNLAVAAQIPIVPVVFKSYSDFYNPDKMSFTPGEYTVEVLPPVATAGLTADGVPGLTERVRQSMLEKYNCLSASER